MIKEHNKRKQMEIINMFLLDPDGLNIREVKRPHSALSGSETAFLLQICFCVPDSVFVIPEIRKSN